MRLSPAGNLLTLLAAFAFLLFSTSLPGSPASATEDAAPEARKNGAEASAASPPTSAPELVAVLNAENWQIAEGLMPEEFLERYKSGQWSHEIWRPGSNTVLADLDFVAAGKRNAGRYDIGPRGQVTEVSTGVQPRFIYGPPFPDIDPSDPKAGAKCVWNFFYQSYTLGNSLNSTNLDLVGPGGLERRLVIDVHQRFFDGQPENHKPQANPQNYLFQAISGVVWPADLQGTVALTHRFRDPNKRDQQWSYVPALRRVRAVSPANRSDGFLGSDMSQDDGSYFDGKPEDFEWHLLGDAEQLVPYDRTALVEHKHNIRPLPGGATETRDDARARFAYQVRGWSGDGPAWLPLRSTFVLVRRPVWIVEGRPKDPYYLYGKLILRFEKLNWRGTYSSKYDWKGEILNSYMPSYGPYFSVAGAWRWHAWSLFTIAQNWKANRATVSYPAPQRPTYRYRIRYADDFFTVDKLSRRGK